eukprot:GILI01001788.1.p1 GENE.GILI01001788.1~~GILI01001788.1.p1  ORF type:complete len:1045 (+),score=336.05 GILI01001788.1:182-3316(+)
MGCNNSKSKNVQAIEPAQKKDDKNKKLTSVVPDNSAKATDVKPLAKAPPTSSKPSDDKSLSSPSPSPVPASASVPAPASPLPRNIPSSPVNDDLNKTSSAKSDVTVVAGASSPAVSPRAHDTSDTLPGSLPSPTSVHDKEPTTDLLAKLEAGPSEKLPKVKSMEDYKNLNCSISAPVLPASDSLDTLSWPAYRDWSAEFRKLTRRIRRLALASSQQDSHNQYGAWPSEELVQAELQMKELTEDFVNTSRRVAALVVRWKVDPVDLGNMYGQGGDKYVGGGLVLRKVKDWIILGENIGEGAAANKVADHELTGLNLIRGKVDGVEVPIACIVDYFGIRFLSQSIVPISVKSIVYGSNTDGLVVYNNQAQAEDKASEIASLLNLAPHQVREKGTKRVTELRLPFTLEMHDGGKVRDEDGENKVLYVMNAGRVLPPDNPSDDSIDCLTKVMRPEYLCSYNEGLVPENWRLFTWAKPVKCDECTNFIDDFEYYHYEKRSVDKRATLVLSYFCCLSCFDRLLPTEGFKYPVNKLKRKVLPEKERATYWLNLVSNERSLVRPIVKKALNPDAFTELCADSPEQVASRDKEPTQNAKSVTDLYMASKRLQDDVVVDFFQFIEDVHHVPLTGKQLTEEMHRRGINLRCLGRMAVETPHNHLRELAVREILARTIKVLVRDGLSFLAEDPSGFTEEDVKKCVLHYLNEVFTVDSRQSSLTIWEYITDLVQKKYCISVNKDVLSKVHKLGLVHSIADKLNVRLARFKGFDFSSVQPFSISDIESVQPKVKFQQVVSSSLTLALERARAMDEKGKRSLWYLAGGHERETASEMYRSAIALAERIYGPQDIRTAHVVIELAEQMESRHQEKGRPEASRWNRCHGVPSDELSEESRMLYQRGLEMLEKINGSYDIEVAECYIALARLSKQAAPGPDALRDEDEVMGAEELTPTFEFLLRAADIIETVVGADHPETADIYTKIALATQELGCMEDASPWIRKAFCIFYKVLGGEHPITLQTWHYLKGIEVFMDSSLDQIPIEELVDAIHTLELEEETL